MIDTILCGDNVTVLRGLSSACVDMCVTSPPYYGLRDYQVDGQIGLEETPELYVSRLVEVFREVWRVMKDDGTCWINLGDSYNGSGGPGGWVDNKQTESFKGEFKKYNNPNRKVIGLKPKDLIGIPWMVAFALRADGWYLRSDIIWSKPNPMPESVADRPTKAHEYIFLLSKSERYYYDAEAIREPAAYPGDDRKARANGNHKYTAGEMINGIRPGASNYDLDFRNKRSVWTVTTKPYAEAHFATFPPDLIKPCILAGSRAGGVVLDPFFGSGTTGFVARELGRYFIGIDLNPEYIKLAERRTARANVPLPGLV